MLLLLLVDDDELLMLMLLLRLLLLLLLLDYYYLKQYRPIKLLALLYYYYLLILFISYHTYVVGYSCSCYYCYYYQSRKHYSTLGKIYYCYWCWMMYLIFTQVSVHFLFVLTQKWKYIFCGNSLHLMPSSPCSDYSSTPQSLSSTLCTHSMNGMPDSHHINAVLKCLL